MHSKFNPNRHQEPQDEIESSGDEASSSEEESSEESSEDESKPTESSTTAGTREERRAAAKAKKAAALKKRNQGPAQPGDLPPTDSEESDDDLALPANPNHTAKSRSQTQKAVAEPTESKKPAAKVKDISQLSRREREAVQAQQARERYQKLHAEGKTDEAKSDLARLAIIREQREAERQRKLAEKDEKDEQAKERAAIAKEREDRMRAAAAGKLSKKAGGKKK